ncbi:sporozoite surface protein 3 [Plasmodium gonderi]|uniref:Sporozoite surface protein 3 n=1 Tax=Plasmodium gonderi TaxID=77519 RepID=A0A1Y1JU88_PLAGO|nr:sporozoite surface protein 3 [Plasmodium gonderi]GAW83474.1 sporozoite surface protein 3 [Plasmodium gonderi]
MSNLVCYICVFLLLLITPVENRGYVCDFSSEKYNIDFDDYYTDVICYHEIGEGDTIGVIIPKYRDGHENIEILTKCFDEVSLSKSGNKTVSIYKIFNKDEIEVSSSNSLYNTEYLSSILQIKNALKNSYIHCVFESRNAKNMEIHKGVAKISVKNYPVHNDNLSNKHIIDLYNKVDVSKDNSNNKYQVKVEPGHILYILGGKLPNGKYIYFANDCPIIFEYIGDIYKHIFPIINEKEVVYDCPMYYDENETTISIGNLVVTFEPKFPSINLINKEILKKYIKFNIEKKLNILLNGTDNDMGNMDNDNQRYMEQGIQLNESQTSNLQSLNLDKEYCNNDGCVELFENSRCSSICDSGYRVLDGYNISYDIQSVIPCNNGNCTPEDSAEPFFIFAWASIVFFCIIVTILIITIYSIIQENKKIVPDPFYNYDSNIKSSGNL